jgi:hypothetical protein
MLLRSVKTQYFKKYDFSRSFKKNPSEEKNFKTPEVAPMLHFNYQINRSA